MSRVALLGMGEVGRVMAEELRPAGHAIVAWDVAFSEPTSPASRNAADLGVTAGTDAEAAVAGADLVVSAVTAAQTLDAARSAASGLQHGTWYLDLNSSSPAQKRRAAEAVDATGARYVEAALMSPIEPRRLSSPFLLGGPHALAFTAVAASFGLSDVTPVSVEIGRAAATKLCRSVVVKGLESLLLESMLAARHYGVERDVLDSLANILPGTDWEATARYMITRTLQHGLRRSEEMTEAAATVGDAGVEPFMATASAQSQAGAAVMSPDVDLSALSLSDLLDALHPREAA